MDELLNIRIHGTFQEVVGAHNIGDNKNRTILYGAVNMALCSKMYNRVYIFHRLHNNFRVTDITMDKIVSGV
jgi:hypothetical protein